MPRYALVNPQDAVDRLATNVDPAVATKTGWRWLPCPDVARPPFDPATEVVEGPAYTVGASAVTEVWTKRPMTAQEIDARKEARLDAEDRLHFEVHFDLENRVRALEGKAAITRAQYRAALKARL